MKDFFEEKFADLIIILAGLLILVLILLNALCICFTLVMWSKGSPSVCVGFIVSLVLFIITKGITCRIFLGKREKHERSTV